MDQQTLIFILIVAAIIVVALLVWATMRKKRTDHLRDRFGDEYDRTVETTGKRGDAEDNLIEREKRVDSLDIRPLTTSERDRFADEWRDTKALFVDAPQEAVLKADRLLGKMMETKGFPMADFDRRYEDLTVNHGEVARYYRDGHEIADKRGDATTEEMRRALNHYERLYDELVKDAGSAAASTRTTTATQARDVDGDGNADVVTTRAVRPE